MVRSGPAFSAALGILRNTNAAKAAKAAPVAAKAVPKARTVVRTPPLPRRPGGAKLPVRPGGAKPAQFNRGYLPRRPGGSKLPVRPGGAKPAVARMGYPIKGANGARKGSELAQRVMKHKTKLAVGGAAVGGLYLAGRVTKSGTGTDKTGYGQARGMYNY